MPIELSVKGLSGMAAVMKTIEKLTNGTAGIAGIEFHGTARDDGSGLSNAEVADHLKEGSTHTKRLGGGPIKRDFFSASEATKDDIAKKFAEVAEVELAKLARHMERAEAAVAKAGPRRGLSAAQTAANKVAKTIATTAFKDAAEVWRLVIVDNLENGLLFDGNAAEKVGEAYAKKRQKEHGIGTDVVGQATGDLLTNMSDSKAFKFIKS